MFFRALHLALPVLRILVLLGKVKAAEGKTLDTAVRIEAMYNF